MSPSRPIPICYTIASLTTDRAGTERHLLRLIRSLDRTRFDPLLVVLQHSEWTSQFHDPAVPMQVLGFRSFWRPGDWLCVPRLARVFRRHEARIVELHYPDAHLLGAVAARLAGVSATISCRRDAADYYGWKELAYCRLGSVLTTCHLANSHEVVRAVSAVESLSPSRFDVIHNGIDLQEFDVRSRHALPEAYVSETRGRPVVVLAANLRPVKNIPLLLDAARLVLSEIPDVCFAILGDGAEGPRLKQYAADVGIASQLIWTGAVPETAPYLSRATIGCLTSSSEGFSNALLEYMAARLPVVATRVGGAAEAVVEGDTGYLVACRDSAGLARRLVELLRSPAQRERMGAAGRRRVEQMFSHERYLLAQQQLYERLVRPCRRGADQMRILAMARRG